MGNRIISGFLRHLHLRETWVIFMVLGFIMLNFPFIHIFYNPRLIFGIPILFLYLMVGWFVSIFIIFLFVKAISFPDDDKGRDGNAKS